MRTDRKFVLAFVLAAGASGGAAAQDVPSSPAGVWYEFADTHEVRLIAGNRYGVLSFQKATGSGTIACIYTMDLAGAGADAYLTRDSEFGQLHASADCAATASVGLEQEGSGLKLSLAMGDIALDANLSRTSYIPPDGRDSSGADIDISGLTMDLSDADVVAALSSMEGARLLSFQTDFKDSTAHLYYNVASLTPDPAAYKSACEVSRSSGHSIEDSLLTISGSPATGSTDKAIFAIKRQFSPLPQKRPLITTMNSALIKKYGTPTVGWRWVYDAQGLLYQIEEIEDENGRERRAAVTRDAGGKIVSTQFEDPDRLCTRGEGFRIESLVGMYQCGDDEFDYPLAAINGYGSSVNIDPNPLCGAMLDVQLETEGDYIDSARFVALDHVAGNLVMATILTNRVDTVAGNDFKRLQDSSEITVEL